MFVRRARFGALISISFTAAIFSGFGAARADSTEVTPEIARLRILDACVFSEWKDEKKRETAAERCKCAAGKLVKAMTDEEFKAYVKAGKLTSAHKEKWDKAMESCD